MQLISCIFSTLFFNDRKEKGDFRKVANNDLKNFSDFHDVLDQDQELSVRFLLNFMLKDDKFAEENMGLQSTKISFLAGTAVLMIGFPAWAQSTLESLVTEGRFTGELRYRYEFVDQDGPLPVSSDAQAETLRVNLGFETGKYYGFQAAFETQFVQNIGSDDFNDTINKKTKFPVVADPDNQEINQAWLSWSGDQGIGVKLGRQTINLDNQRFIGTVDWRQNDQTFDSLLVSYAGIENALLTYGYIDNVNRVFGDDHPLGDLDSDSHIVNISYKFSDALKLTGYGYWLSFDKLPARSSRTVGARATGNLASTQDWSFSYDAEIASQYDYRGNTSDYNALYYRIEPSVAAYGFTWAAGYEVLGGDGTDSFQTPLATLHKFNGWADKFLDTPAVGLKDAYLSASYKVSGVAQALDGTVVTAVYHDFSGDERGDLGQEVDFSIGKSFNLPEGFPFKRLQLLAKYSDYDAEDKPYTDTQKAWLQIGLSF